MQTLRTAVNEKNQTANLSAAAGRPPGALPSIFISILYYFTLVCEVLLRVAQHGHVVLHAEGEGRGGVRHAAQVRQGARFRVRQGGGERELQTEQSSVQHKTGNLIRSVGCSVYLVRQAGAGHRERLLHAGEEAGVGAQKPHPAAGEEVGRVAGEPTTVTKIPDWTCIAMTLCVNFSTERMERADH